MIFSGMERVLQAKFERVKIQGAGNFFHVPVERPIALWHAVAAKRPGRWSIRVYNVSVKADVGAFAVFSIADIERHRLVAGVAGDGQGMRAVGAGVAQGVHFVGGNRPVALDAGFHAHAHRVTRARADEFFFAGVFV